MTTQTPTPTDNERLGTLEGTVSQMSERMSDMQSHMNSHSAENNAAFDRLHNDVTRLHNDINNLRTLMFMGFGLMWATMVGGFIAILTINP